MKVYKSTQILYEEYSRELNGISYAFRRLNIRFAFATLDQFFRQSLGSQQETRQ